jgi:hypothetical protein
MAGLASRARRDGMFCAARLEGRGCSPRRPLVLMSGYAQSRLVWWVQ